MLKFVVGLTDIVDYDGFIYDNLSDVSDSVNYNIRRPTTDIEKATIEWQIDTSMDAIQNIIPLWEKIIRVPHLCMIRIKETPYNLYPEFTEYSLSVSYINLLPVSKDLIKKFTDNDYEHCNGEAEFGDLCIYMYENIISTNPYGSNITNAYNEKDISILANASTRGEVLPKFFVQFPLRGNAITHDWNRDNEFVKFVNDNREAIEDKGYNINSKRITNYGPITVGKLLTDPNEAYENLTKYPRICRTSFVQTEE